MIFFFVIFFLFYQKSFIEVFYNYIFLGLKIIL